MPLHSWEGPVHHWAPLGLDRALIVAVLIVDLVLVLNAVLGLHCAGHSLQLVPDPAGQFLRF
jgi:hypothetical protein